MTPAEYQAWIEAKANEPASVSADGVSVTNRSLSDLANVRGDVVTTPAGADPFTRRLRKLIPPGSAGVTVV